MLLTTTVQTPHAQRLPATPRHPSVAGLGAVPFVLLMFIIAVMLNYNHCRRMLRNLREDLFGIRRRSNAFDDHTANEVRTSIILVLQLCFCQALLLFYHFSPAVSDYSQIGITLLCLFGLTVGLYVFNVASYAVVGNIFGDKTVARIWLRGFNSCICVASLVLIFPTILATYYPGISNVLIIISLAIFIIVKIFFLVKGFRIFYDKIYSLLYFILYLCTLEIIPLVALYTEAARMCR